MEAREYYTYLLTKYYDGQASAEEVEELFAELGKEMDQEEWSALIESLHRQAGQDLQYDPVRWQLMADQITGTGNQKAKLKRMNRWWMAAAAVAVIAVAGIFTWQSGKKQAELPVVAKADSTDIAPGGNRAQLKLADGRVIDLDAAANGQLTSGNGAVVTKKSDGSIEYSKQGRASSISMHTLSTPRGGQYQLRLPDGTRVWLNAASSINYPAAFTGKERRISVTGEAYLEVARDPQMPFRVNIDNRSEVEVLGTSFNINAYADEPATKTTLVEGSVRMVVGNESQKLSPGEQATLQHGELTVNNNADIESVLAWKNGQFPMKNVDLPAFMRQVSRWYDVDVQFKGNTNKTIFGGFMSREVKLNTLMKALEVYGIKTKLENKTLIVE